MRAQRAPRYLALVVMYGRATSVNSDGGKKDKKRKRLKTHVSHINLSNSTNNQMADTSKGGNETVDAFLTRTLDSRMEEAERIRQSYPDRLPCIVTRSSARISFRTLLGARTLPDLGASRAARDVDVAGAGNRMLAESP